MSEQFDGAYWEDRYRHASHGGPGASQPSASPQLVTEVRHLEPGVALDAGCGEGGNAAWLAGQGWRVTAVDISPTALARGREHAATLGDEGVAGRIEWVHADLTDWVPPREAFDLVTSHYVHPVGGSQELLRRLAAAVAPGGTLLVVDHDHADEHAHAHASVDELTVGLDPEAWVVEVGETRVRRQATGHGHGHDHGHGHGHTLHDVVVRARRRS